MFRRFFIVSALLIASITSMASASETQTKQQLREINFQGETLPVASPDIDLLYLDTTSELETRYGISVVADEQFEAMPGVLVTRLHRPSDPTADLFMFQDTGRGLIYFLRIENNPLVERTVRIWSFGSSEIVIREEPTIPGGTPEISIGLENVSASADQGLTFLAGKSEIGDAIACIARTLGISINTTTLKQLLSSSVCTASSLTILVLTATNCVSIPPTPSTVVGCLAGIAQAVSCNIANCSSDNSNCLKSISLNRRTGDTWNSNCQSTHRSGSFAKFFTFQLTSRTRVTIDLDGSVDSYLFLLEGNGTNGRVLASDDDSGPGSDARISITLNSGRYTVEATTYARRQTGSFALRVSR